MTVLDSNGQVRLALPKGRMKDGVNRAIQPLSRSNVPIGHVNRELRSEGVNNAGYLGTFAGVQPGDGQICWFNPSSGNYESIITWR